jgi:SRSO17 transposase
MERMEETVPDAGEQSLQHFISNSTWDARAVMNQVAADADAVLGGFDDTILVIDDSGIPKKGTHSVGVSRQYCGQTGKIDNCQVGVYASLVHGAKATLIDARLFLPERWTSDEERCEKAGVPVEERQFRTKHVIALEIVQNALDSGVRFGYVAFDGFYGENGELLRILDGAGLRFLADVHKDQRMFADDPQKLQKGNAVALRVDEWVAAQPAQTWRRVTIRQGTKGPIEIELLHRRVWFWKTTDEQSYCWHLIVRREVGHPEEIKYTLSNAAPDVPKQQLAYLQGQRYWVERCLQDAKQQAGLGDYQVRGWVGWHHHMAMVLMATLFMLEQRIESGEDLPLTCGDIEWVLKQMLPSRGRTEDEILSLLEKRLRKRGAPVAANSPPE